MKKLQLLLIAGVSLLALASCSKPTQEEIIKETVTVFYENMYTGNFNEAAKYGSEKAQDELYIMSGIVAESPEEIEAMKKAKIDIKILGLKMLDENTAEVTYEVKGAVGAFDFHNEISPLLAYAVNENGVWKVDLHYFDKKDPEEQAAPQE